MPINLSLFVLNFISKETKTITHDNVHFSKMDKYFSIEITRIMNKNSFIGTVILFKDITQHINDMETIKNNQDIINLRNNNVNGVLIGETLMKSDNKKNTLEELKK